MLMSSLCLKKYLHVITIKRPFNYYVRSDVGHGGWVVEGGLRKIEQRQTGRGGVVRSERSHFKRFLQRIIVAMT